MQIVEQMFETISVLELKVFIISHEIEVLTGAISVHRSRAAKISGRKPLAKSLNEWRRKSFELHRLRSKMKSTRDALMTDIYGIRNLLEEEMDNDMIH